MPTSPMLPKLVGQRIKRREDPRLIQGTATYVDDIALVGMQHMAFKRSDVAHGRIRSIDTSAAEEMDGVEAVFTGAQIAEFLAPMPIGTAPMQICVIARYGSAAFLDAMPPSMPAVTMMASEASTKSRDITHAIVPSPRSRQAASANGT